MKTIFVPVFVIIMISCSKKNDDIEVTNIDQLVGNWKWESTCGGIINSCTYPSKTQFLEIDLYANGQYIHKTNDHIDLQADYTLEKTDDISGTLVLNIDTAIYTEYYSKQEKMPIKIGYNRLNIYRGELSDSYVKIK